MRKYEFTILGQDNEGLMVFLDRVTVTAPSMPRAVDKLSGMYTEGSGTPSERFRGEGPILSSASETWHPLMAHDGYVEHSHEVRSDHRGVARKVANDA